MRGGLFKAAMAGDTDTVIQILSEELDDAVRNKGCNNALIYAALKGQTDTLRRLCDFGADVNFQGPVTQTTPLMFAARYKHIDVIKYLLSRGADSRLKDNEGRSAYDFAVCSEDMAIIALLKLERE